MAPVNRCGQEIQGAGLHCIHRRLNVSIGTRQDDGHVGCGPLQLFEQFDAVHVGERCAQANEVEGAALAIRERLGGTRGKLKVAGLIKNLLQRFPYRPDFIHDQNGCARNGICS
ncbi:MAG: hypothetical protein QNJ04_10210, partial [Desulfobacterales bacterium]|nr:hypothetical protein [Desulfobacterales bacterium]